MSEVMTNKARGGFHHIAIEVADMDRSIAFYRNLLGMRLTERHEANEVAAIPVALAFLRSGEDHHDLVLAHDPNKTYRERTAADVAEGIASFHHMAFECADHDAWEAQLDKVRSLGLEIVRGPLVHSPWHPRGDGSWGENESFYVLDPDGHRVEMFCDMACIDTDGSYIDASGEKIDGPRATEI